MICYVRRRSVARATERKCRAEVVETSARLRQTINPTRFNDMSQPNYTEVLGVSLGAVSSVPAWKLAFFLASLKPRFRAALLREIRRMAIG